MVVLAYVISAVVGYLLGGINAGIIISKAVAHLDIRKVGSGNAGTTNVLRVLGLKPAVFTVVVDCAKGAVSVALAMLWFKLLCPEINSPYGLQLTALAAVLGHMYPIYFGFKGGKGVITFAGAMAVMHLAYVGIALALFIVLVWATKYVSLGSVAAVFSYVVLIGLFALGKGQLTDEVWIEMALAFAPIIIIIYKHRSNISRLLAGTERKISFSKKIPIPAEAIIEDTKNSDTQQSLNGEAEKKPEMPDGEVK